jgi:hypothetical protein
MSLERYKALICDLLDSRARVEMQELQRLLARDLPMPTGEGDGDE